MSGPDPLLITFEILLTIVTPLLALYLRGQWPLRTVTACLCGIPVVWYLTYAPIHELSHALGTTLVGGKIGRQADPQFLGGHLRGWLG
jgi:hypothetical protein